MALIVKGSLDDFSAVVATKERADFPALRDLKTFSVLREATRKVQPVPVEFVTSDTPRGLALKSIKLTKGFEGFLGDILWNKTNEIYFLAWAWDLSGKPIVQYPGAKVKKEAVIIQLITGQLREFLGAGILLFPAKQITGGLAVRIQVWECDGGARDFGKAMVEVANTIKTSQLSQLLSLISTAVGTAGLPTGITVELIKDAVVELTGAVGKILQANSDDYVDFYEGYYPAADPWTGGDEAHKGYASDITLTRLT
jgi:hypothetical protein